jgi:MFS family permease
VTTAQERVRYRTVLRNAEFRAVFAAENLSLLGDQLARIALAILVFQRSGSAFQASATYAISYGAYLVSAPLLSGLSDRYPRLSVMVACDLLRIPLVLGLALAVDVPMWVLFGLIFVLGAAGPVFDSARSALQPDILAGEEYVVANTLMNVCVQVSQILGFVLGGAVVAATSVRSALVVDAASFLLSAGLLLRSVRQRPAAMAETASFLRDTRDGLRLVLGSTRLQVLLAFAVLTSVPTTSTEGLAVPLAHDLGGGDLTSGVLTACVPAGFMIGSVLVLRVPSERRELLLPWLTLMGTVPLLLTPALGWTAAVVAVWVLAGVGATTNLIAGPAFVQACPPDYRGRAYGVATAILMSTQGAGLFLGGWLGTLISPAGAVACVGLVMLLLAAPLLWAQGNRETGRKQEQ